jgi:hypothetical protein
MRDAGSKLVINALIYIPMGFPWGIRWQDDWRQQEEQRVRQLLERTVPGLGNSLLDTSRQEGGENGRSDSGAAAGSTEAAEQACEWRQTKQNQGLADTVRGFQRYYCSHYTHTNTTAHTTLTLTLLLTLHSH